MSAIVSVLNQYSDVLAQVQDLEQRIAQVAGDLIAQRDDAQAQAEALKKQAQNKAKFIPQSQAHTLVGRLHQFVWNVRKPAWDDACLRALAARYGIDWAEFEQCGKSQPKGFWSLRARSSGK